MPVRATLVTRAGEIHNGKVQAVGTRIDPVTRTLTVRAEIPNPDLKLIPGSTFSVSVQLAGQRGAGGARRSPSSGIARAPSSGASRTTTPSSASTPPSSRATAIACSSTRR